MQFACFIWIPVRKMCRIDAFWKEFPLSAFMDVFCCLQKGAGFININVQFEP